MRRLMGILATAGCVVAAQVIGAPGFRATDVRPHGSAEPDSLRPGLLTWIFGTNLSRSPGCTVENPMVPKTYKTELCGTRVIVGEIEAQLIAVMPGQINLVLPDHPWENEMVPVQIVRDGVPSAVVPVRFGYTRPVISLAEPAYAGLPVWVRVQRPSGTGWLRYPFYTEPWDIGSGYFQVRSQGRDVPFLSTLPFPPHPRGGGWMVGLPREPAREYLNRIPLHLLFSLDSAGKYQVRYTEYRYVPEKAEVTIYQQSDWTPIEILSSTADQRNEWFVTLAASQPDDTVELLADYLPRVLARRDESALKLLAHYLDSPDSLVQTYSAYALNYFDPDLIRRLLPGRQPLRGSVR